MTMTFDPPFESHQCLYTVVHVHVCRSKGLNCIAATETSRCHTRVNLRNPWHAGCRGGINDKGFGFAFSAWFIVASVILQVSLVVSLLRMP